MCGRLLSERYRSRSQRAEQLAREQARFARSVGAKYAYEDLFLGRFNVAPTQNFPVLRQGTDGPDLYVMQWRFVPAWSKTPKPSYNTINAVGESIDQKPAFRTAWRRSQRCLIPVTGWYEWRGARAARQPYLVHSTAERVSYLGGVWDRWQEADQVLESFAVITTAANPALQALHQRMPLVIDAANDELWLAAEPATAKALIAPHAGADWEFYPVSRALNSAHNDDESLVTPLTQTAGQV